MDMIYLIGGAARVGKSNLARLILERQKIPFFSTDAFVLALRDVAPELGVKDQLPYPDLGLKFFPYLERLVKYLDGSLDNYVLEGEVILPEFVDKLSRDYSVRAVFLGNTRITLEQMKKHVGKNDWISGLSKDIQESLVPWIRGNSEFFKQECQTYDQPFFDLGKDYQETLQKAYDSLV